MELARQSRFIRFVYCFADWGIPEQTTLCRFAWRTLFMSLLVSAAIGLIGLLFYAVYLDWKAVLGLFALVIGSVFALAGGVFLTQKSLPVIGKVRQTAFGEAVAAVKHRFCPIIQFK